MELHHSDKSPITMMKLKHFLEKNKLRQIQLITVMQDFTTVRILHLNDFDKFIDVMKFYQCYENSLMI